MIPQDFIQDLLSRTDIVSVVGEHVRLKKRGANHFGCCPFHNENTPSFSVSPGKGFYHCFGCKASGSAITFLMDHTGASFTDAVADLAGRLGLSVPRDEPPGLARRQFASGTELLGRIAAGYHLRLRESAGAQYAAQRGLNQAIIDEFMIGFADDQWSGLRTLLGEHYHEAELIDTGMLVEHASGRRYDRFRGRLMFPIRNPSGAVVGFGGRVIGKGEPKYLNSPETALFDKGRELYGLHENRKGIGLRRQVTVVEGYMDVVSLAQHGVRNAVATLGTATTARHIERLLRSADHLTFCFDGDRAGRDAARRAMLATLEAVDDGKSVRFATLPAGEDPDSYVKQHGAEGFNTVMLRAPLLSQFMLDTLAQKHGTDSAEARNALLLEARDMLARIVRAPMFRMQMISEVADLARIDASALTAALDAGQAVRPTMEQKKAPVAEGFTRMGALLRIILLRPSLALRIAPAMLDESPDAGAIMAIRDLFDIGEIEGNPPAAALMVLLDQHPSAAHLKQTLQAPPGLFDEMVDEDALAPFERLEATFDDIVGRLALDNSKSELDQLKERMRAGKLTDQDKVRMLTLIQEGRRKKPIASP